MLKNVLETYETQFCCGKNTCKKTITCGMLGSCPQTEFWWDLSTEQTEFAEENPSKDSEFEPRRPPNRARRSRSFCFPRNGHWAGLSHASDMHHQHQKSKGHNPKTAEILRNTSMICSWQLLRKGSKWKTFGVLSSVTSQALAHVLPAYIRKR